MTQETLAPVTALIEMLEAAEIQELTTVFDHTPEEIGLHVMENHREVLTALASPPSSDAKMTRLIMTPHAGVHYVEEAGIAAPSYITNCYFKRREEDDSPYLFRDDKDGNIIVHLNGYAIVPADEYHALTNPSSDARQLCDACGEYTYDCRCGDGSSGPSTDAALREARDANQDMIAQLRQLARKQEGYGMSFTDDRHGASLNLYGDRARAAIWLFKNADRIADTLARIASIEANSPGIGESGALRERKAVNMILAELIAPYEPDFVKRVEIGNAACSDILAALNPSPAASSPEPTLGEGREP